MAVLFCWERGRFLTSVASVQDHVVVSVHALRGERRTNGKRAAGRTEISIHAPREGSDSLAVFTLIAATTFLSTLPARGATCSCRMAKEEARHPLSG